MRDPSLVLMPPRPRIADWILAGASAGAVLGLAELAIVFLGGHSPPPPLSLLVIAAEVLAVAVGGLIGSLTPIAGWVVSASPSSRQAASVLRAGRLPLGVAVSVADAVGVTVAVGVGVPMPVLPSSSLTYSTVQ